MGSYACKNRVCVSLPKDHKILLLLLLFSGMVSGMKDMFLGLRGHIMKTMKSYTGFNCLVLRIFSRYK